MLLVSGGRGELLTISPQVAVLLVTRGVTYHLTTGSHVPRGGVTCHLTTSSCVPSILGGGELLM